MNFISSILPWLLESTLRGSAGILLVLLLRPLLRRYAGAQSAHLLWLIALVPLLSPWTPAGPFSLPLRAAALSPASPSATQTLVRVSVDDVPAQRVTVPIASVSPSTSWTDYLMLTWVAGAAGVWVLAIVRATRAGRLVSRAPEISEHAVIRTALASLSKVPARLRVRETDELRSPALCGILKPTILLPLGWWTELKAEELRCVLLHEIGHLRRGDLVWRWAFLVAQALHWFNPLVWLAGRAARTDQELACDEWVLAQERPPASELYGEVLLKATALLGRARLTSPAHATMAESKAGLTRRIRHLLETRPHGWFSLAATLAIAGVGIISLAPARSVAASAPAPAPLVSTETSSSPPVETQEARSPASLIEIEAKFVEISQDALPAELLAAREPAGAAESPAPAITADAIDALLFGTDAQRSAVSPGMNASVFTDPQFQVVVRALNEKKGVDLLSAPRVTTKSGQNAVIEIIREFRYPVEFSDEDANGLVWPKNFETRNTGVTLEVTPEITSDGRIELLLKPQVVEFLGFVNYRAGRPARPATSTNALASLLEPMTSARVINQPIFRTRKISTAVTLSSGQTALVGGMGQTDEKVANERLGERIMSPALDGTNTTKVIPRSLYIFVTARLIHAGSNPSSSSTLSTSPGGGPSFVVVPSSAPNTPAVPASGSALPATPVPNKPGFMTSPYALSAGNVDVRGFPPGTEVKCPYTGKMFLVP